MKAPQHLWSTHDETPAEDPPAEDPPEAPIDIIIGLLEILEAGDS